MKKHSILILSTILVLQSLMDYGMNLVVRDDPAFMQSLKEQVNQFEQTFAISGDWQWDNASDYPYDIDTMRSMWLMLALSKIKDTNFIAKMISKGAPVNKIVYTRVDDTIYPSISLDVAMRPRSNFRHDNIHEYFSNIELLVKKGAIFYGKNEGKATESIAVCIKNLNVMLAHYYGNKDWAIKEEHIAQCVKRLIDVGCPIKVPQGCSLALKEALGMPKTVSLLLQMGEDPSQQYLGKTVIDYAKDLVALETHQAGAIEGGYSARTSAQNSLAIIEDNVRRKKLAQEIPELRKNLDSHLAKLPAELLPLIGKYIAY